MRTKLIRMTIAKKINAWLDTIKHEGLKAELKDGVIVTGGCIASMLLGERPNDYDVYFKTKDLALKVAQYYVNIWNENPPARSAVRAVKVTVQELQDRVQIVVKSAGVAAEGQDEIYHYFEGLDPRTDLQARYLDEVSKIAEELKAEEDKGDYRPVFLSSNAISLSGKVQLIFRFYGEPDEIHENYDFAHCTNYWTSWGKEVVLRSEALECLLNKELRYVGSRYPICSVLRIRKFLDRGFHINAGQIVKMAWQISHLDLGNIEVLQDQLTGVDQAYFHQLITSLKNHAAGNGALVDQTYLMELIDKIF